MGEAETAKPETETTVEKVVSPPPPAQADVDDSKALVIVEKVEDPALKEKTSGGSKDRDIALAKVETDKRTSMIKAWEESQKSKAENKAEKKLATIASWENTQKANKEAELKKYEELMEKKKAEFSEKIKNKVVMLHKEAEDKRALIEAKRGEEILRIEEMAAKYRATGFIPKKILGCFGG